MVPTAGYNNNIRHSFEFREYWKAPHDSFIIIIIMAVFPEIPVVHTYISE